uniref:Chitin-binding type-2 domain-containing protein n=1 Tax=Anopheles culicifacies TaxID=139723 RepID=A0A182MIY2_9DIPT
MGVLDQKVKMFLVLWFAIVGLACGTELAPKNTAGECTTDARCPLIDNSLYSVFLPHQTQCDKFYHCAYGKACEWTCPSGLHWSTLLNRCEWPSVACCDPSVDCLSLNPSTSTTTTTTTVATPGNTPSTSSPCSDDARCPLDDDQSRPKLLSHETDCGSFYACSYGKRCPLKCPAGQHFSVQLQRCDWPQFACCDATISCQQLPTTVVVPTVVPSDAPSSNCLPDTRCPLGDDPLKPVLLAVPGNCGAFYKCRIGEACLLSCPTGQHFSQTLQVCEWPAVACCDPSIPCT